jgi:hypothetical protein
MIKIELLKDTRIRTFAEVRKAYMWCFERFGNPGDDGLWYYSKNPDFLDSTFVSGPEEIEFLHFKNEEDAMAFKLSH